MTKNDKLRNIIDRLEHTDFPHSGIAFPCIIDDLKDLIETEEASPERPAYSTPITFKYQTDLLEIDAVHNCIAHHRAKGYKITSVSTDDTGLVTIEAGGE